ncbi:MAG: LacI family DNA-binding transcriptional regulator [Victivallaceae bacterium]
MKKPARLKDIAASCGVSCATVSDVLNGKSLQKGIKAETQEKILKTAKLLRYQANSNARSIVTGKSNLIAALLPSVSNSFYGPIYDSFQSFLNDQGYSVMLFLSGLNQTLENKFIDKILALQAEGCLAVPCSSQKGKSSVGELKAYGVPTIFFDVVPPVQGADFFCFDNYQGAYAATKYLLELGRRNIVLFIRELEVKPYNKLDVDRMNGFSDACKNFDVLCGPDNFYMVGRKSCDTNDYFSLGYHCTAELLETKPETNAIICTNDEFALGAYKAAEKRNLKIPRDISIIGYGNRRFAEYMAPPLTTLHQNLKELGEILGQYLFEKIKSGKAESQGIKRAIPTPLIERESCAKWF